MTLLNIFLRIFATGTLTLVLTLIGIAVMDCNSRDWEDKPLFDIGWRVAIKGLIISGIIMFASLLGMIWSA